MEALPIDIYIKPAKKATLSQQTSILIQDVAEVVAETNVAEKVKNMKLLDIDRDNEQKKSYLVSVTDIIKTIKKKYPDYTVNNVGEMDTLVQYAAKKSQDRPWLKWLRIAFVVLVLFVGSSTAIMSFHTDGQMSKIFENYYRIIYGHERTNPRIVNIPYSIGVAVGIIVFYNHFMGKKITDDPTPIEVEMELYEKDVTETIVEVLNQRKNAREDGVKNGDT
ncbi:MAG: stage V sporulation protein AA [Defluviitaleaceae bacterium]|nr:stage V sporulation protein AA [Defluviitaleaceae bacterium]